MALPVTTVVPFSTLPACATLCGHLYDANGACVPPAAPTADANTYDVCFCNYNLLQPFKTGTAGVCDNACTADPGGLGSIRNWFTSFCANADNHGVAPTSTATSSSTVAAGASSNSNGSHDNYSWLSSHWQWVVFLIVMVVAIVGIWVGACLWRRHYLRKKDRQYQLGKHLARASGQPNVSNTSHLPDAGILAPAPISAAGVFDPEKTSGAPGQSRKERKKWIVKERT